MFLTLLLASSSYQDLASHLLLTCKQEVEIIYCINQILFVLIEKLVVYVAEMLFPGQGGTRKYPECQGMGIGTHHLTHMLEIPAGISFAVS